VLRAKITGTGAYVPENILTNFDLEKMVETTDEWITERTGIKERRIVDKDQTASALAFEASKKALQSAGIKAKDLDIIIVATVTGDMVVPATACILQDKLGAKKAAAFDLSAACSGFLYGLSIADNFIRSGTYKKILLVGTEVLSKFTDWQDRSTCVLFGDGAGAAVIEPEESGRGIMSVHLSSDGSLWDLLCLPGGGSKYPASKESLQERLHYLKMRGNETFKVAVRTMERLAMEALKENKLKPSQLALFIPHQANLRIIQATAQRLGLPMDRVLVNLDKYGNTSAASIPIALDEAVRTHRIQDGDYILLVAFGGGLTWGAALIRW